MGVSTKSVFHFLPQKSILNSILKDGGFKMKYCSEEIHLSYGKFEGAVPMVSFCDIPFSKSEKHLKSYGFYGLGLSKNWAIENKLNPVLYLEKDSSLCQMLEPLLVTTLNEDEHGGIDKRYLMEDTGDGKIKITDIFTGERKLRIESAIALLSFSKNRSGRLERTNKKTIEDYNFYAEREFRYVPTESTFNDKGIAYQAFLNPTEYNEYKEQPIEDRFIKNMLLVFNSKDLDYIIVKDEKEIPATIKQLRKYKHLYTTEEELEMMYSKIVSSKRLLRDV